ncbi:hypothetical protein A2797_01905 [candidate division WWE3 bacterium RIFCSPHIGHO2_01_FULL_48_15]|uniref:Mannosyl-glycoprotein endo-beta-N-acetylglucosamidase-like domain-containing protein n=1 Tax=candidate division WWE3 bacterium RIFCSPHIGHO2_01_FULL_48_15 TaxID=1802619 RepID=A0A1F4VH74_UNCKA|nr:MAG: hypothetical protein A2797_01905 [candidate division WWE3 bacterium RIFCSPHIGHO2_01_FULL_48_15]
MITAPFFQVKEAFAPIMPPVPKVDKRIVHLESFLAGYNSPLAAHADTFVATADQYGLDWRLLPAIAGTESTLGKRYIVGTYNPFGWGSGKIRFASWEHAIETVGQKLYEKYYLSGTRPLTIEQVGDIYAESPRWPRSVRFWIKKIGADQISALLQ